MSRTWRLIHLRDQQIQQTITTTVDVTPELSPAPDCRHWKAEADPDNTAVVYYTLDERVPSSAADSHDGELAAGDVLESQDHHEAAATTLRFVAASGSQTVRIRPRYL